MTTRLLKLLSGNLLINLPWNRVGFPFCHSTDFNLPFPSCNLWESETVVKLLCKSLVTKLNLYSVVAKDL